MTQTSAQTRAELLKLLRLESRGAANRQGARIQELIGALEHAQPADLSSPEALAQLEGVWELRWSSSRQPYLTVAPWLENLQCLAPSQGRGMNLLCLSGPIGALAGFTVLDDDLRICCGNAGTLFALTRRRDLKLQDLLLAQPN